MDSPDITLNNAPGFTRAPGYSITIKPAGQRSVVRHQGITLADTTDALILNEADYAPVLYIPAHDIRMDLMTASEHTTYCPFKGHATYWSLEDSENIAWSYEDPYDEVMEIKGHVAFYADKVDPS